MAFFLFWLSVACFCFATIFFLELAINCRRIEYLKDFDPSAADNDDLPLISIIVPARNEAREIERAIESLLNQDYPHVELIAVDDRSTDGTGDILDRIAEEHQQLRVFHVDELPGGWLGKNHAMHFAARQADGEWLLLTDADVVMDPTTLRRAVSYVRARELDHLTMAPEAEMPTGLLQAFVVTFIILFSAYFKPWKVKNPRSKAHVGIGAFNLVRAEVYRAVGTHETIRMRPDDDVKLGKIIKLGGFKQDVVYGAGLIRVRWYSSLRELIDGLMKNAFSGVDYRLEIVVFATLAMLAFFVWPFVGIFISAGAARWFYAGAVMLLLLLFVVTAVAARMRWWLCVLFPLCILLMIYIQWRATLLTYFNNGIRWRDTHYSLAELKANKV
jgi:cellulose synthase/poly-beta-1,6-N-acetylglucosamine synthase-like glycosyltransferase